ncbi:MAG: NADP-dependent isocitrate dehydrogenase [Candidatus Methylomirabilia bacterium]
MSKITVKNPLVELDGDEMTRIIWQLVKDKLVLPFLDVRLEYYDLGLPHRDATDDTVTFDAAAAIARHGVGVKCATITPSMAQVAEHKLKKAWPSPNGAIRSALDGTVFRKPIICPGIPTAVKSWVKPIAIGRHAYGDIYNNREYQVPGPGKAELVFTPAGGGEPVRITIHDFTGPGVIMGMHNTEKSIRSFARACLGYALSEKVDLWFATKDTISKTYHTFFKTIFAAEAAARAADFKAAGIAYRYLLIDDAVAQIVKHEGGILWALMNYDGDVQSDMVAAGFGSLGMMTSVLVSPDGKFEYEAAHGTVTRHYKEHLAGKTTSTNSVATIFAWSGALRKRGELDGTPAVSAFAGRIEAAVLETITGGTMTRDLARIIHGTMDPPRDSWVDTAAFIDAVAQGLVR